MCVWLYTSLGYEVLEKAVHLLRSEYDDNVVCVCVCVCVVIVILSVYPAGGLQGDRKPELTKGVVDLCVDHVDIRLTMVLIVLIILTMVLIIQNSSGDDGVFLTWPL